MKKTNGLNKIEEILPKLDFEPSAALSERIIFAVYREKQKIVRIKLALYSGASVLAVAPFSFVGQAAISEISKSGVTGLISLSFSDFSFVLSNWSDFALSVMEALPVLPIIYVLLSIMTSIVLVSAVLKNFRKFKSIKLIPNFK